MDNEFQRLKALFDRLAELEPAERNAWLDSARELDEATRARLRSLFSADAALDGMTVRPVLRGSVNAPASASAWLGRRVGPFVIERELGHGGMGSVFLAHRADGRVTQQVAVKLIRPERLDENTLARFRLERQVLALLSHPNIATLLDLGELEDGTPYVVMELVDGVPITTYAHDLALDLHQRLRLFLTVCDAVACAHRSLIVHRDLKPNNILVTAQGVPKLLDFGIAKPLQAQLGAIAVEETGTAQRYFSLHNAAPEQLRGETVTVACDIYALGVLLYELLAGKAPFDITGKAPGEIERAILEKEPVPPSARSSDKQLRGDLDSIILRCLQKLPSQRYRSVAELTADIERHLAGRPVAARKRARRTALAVRIVVVALLLIAFAFVRWGLPTNDPYVLAVAPKAPSPWPKPDTLKIVEGESLRSLWVEGEKERYGSLLKGHACDTLVVPVQSQGEGFDRATRSLMTAQLALLLGSNGKHCVVDPYWAARALGDGMRRYNEAEVHELAEAVEARTIVWTYAGHDGNLKMDLFVRVERADPGDQKYFFYHEAVNKAWAGVPFGDEQPPFVVWQGLLSEVAGALGLEASLPASLADASTPLVLPREPHQLVTSSADLMLGARRFELLASLAPAQDSRGAERLHEKAWLAAATASDTPESRHVRSRALYHLGYRPAALALLNGDDTAEARLLRALLDGNLPEAQQAESELTDSREQLLAALEVHDLALIYERAGKQRRASVLEKLTATQGGWRTLLEARAGDLDVRHEGDNRALKVLLDHDYPIAGYSLEEVLRGTAAVGDAPQEGELDLLPTRHVKRLLAQQADKFCCAPLALHPTEFDFLDLLAARAIANLEKGIAITTGPKDLEVQSLQRLQQYDAEFAGHPHFSALRARAQMELLATSRGVDRRTQEREKDLIASARSAAYWEQGATLSAFKALQGALEGSMYQEPFRNAYGAEFPPKPLWAPVRRALAYSCNDLTPIGRPRQRVNQDDRKLWLEALDHRFHGAPDAGDVRELLAGKKAEDNVVTLRQRLAEDPENWDLHARLANLLIVRADYVGAAEIVQHYPGFKPDSAKSPATLSNHAYSLGMELYWRGAMEQARSLYGIAARYESSSEARMLAQQHLYLLDGNYADATRLALARVRQYHSRYAYRDYLGMLFAYGASKDAWPAFGKATELFVEGVPELWVAALIGHRVEGASAQKVADWLTSEPIRTIRMQENIPALWLGTVSFLIDRAPYPQLADVLTKVEGPLTTRFSAMDGHAQRRLPGTNVSYRPIMRSKFLADQAEPAQEGDAVPSEFVLFARAYEQMRAGDHAAAVTSFAHLANSYSIEGTDFDHGIDLALPYFAFSAVKTGDTLALKSFLDGLPQHKQRFAFHLAQAYFAGLSGSADDALVQLQQAMGKITADPISISAYMYAEACLRLFEETGDARFRDLALDWARKYQRLDPTMAWAYALEARYGDPKDKGHLRAVALAYHLDRNSYWLSGVAQADIERAKVWLKQNNPFRATGKTQSIVGLAP